MRNIFGIIIVLITTGHLWGQEAIDNLLLDKNWNNVIYINVDDLGYKDLEIYKSDFFETPNISRLSREGLTFTQGYATAANCAPSRACLMSGRNTPAHGIYTVGTSERGNSRTRKIIPIKNKTVLVDTIFTMAEMFKKKGYTTGIFGKWHLSEDPKKQGFDVNIGGGLNGSPGKDGYFSPYNISSIEDNNVGENLTNRLTEEAIQFIGTNRDKPFFAYLSYYAVHTPLQTYPMLAKKYLEKGGDENYKRATYAGMIETVDKNIGKLMSALESFDLENTLIVFTSDNGGIRAISSQAPLRGGKGSYYEGGIRVPYVVRWKGVIEPNTMSDIPISNLDFFPTFKEFLEVSLPNKKLDGVSLIPLFKGSSIDDRALYFHFPIYLEAYDRQLDDGRDPLFRTRPGSVIIHNNWKLHQYYEDGGLELYNLKIDIGERKNLANEEPKMTKELLKDLDNWRSKNNALIPLDRNPDYIENFVPN